MPEHVLVIETSTEMGSIAIARGAELLAEFSFTSRDPSSGARTEALAPAVAACMARASISARDLSAIVCGEGPGGFTSLRAAAAVAKGMCSALDISLYAMSSLELLAWSAAVPDGSYIAALNAGRNEWFCADFTYGLGESTFGASAYMLSDDELRTRASGTDARLVGHHLDIDISPSASAAVPKLFELMARGPVDLNSWEPAYGRLAEAQVKWEAAHGRPLSA